MIACILDVVLVELYRDIIVGSGAQQFKWPFSSALSHLIGKALGVDWR